MVTLVRFEARSMTTLGTEAKRQCSDETGDHTHGERDHVERGNHGVLGLGLRLDPRQCAVRCRAEFPSVHARHADLSADGIRRWHL